MSISVFIGSSFKEITYRKRIGNRIRQLNDVWEQKGVRIYLKQWEDFRVQFRGKSKQQEYIDSPRDSQSELCSRLGLPKEFAQMDQKLKEMHTQEDDSLFYYHSSEDLANALLDDIDYHFNKVKCRKIEGLMPRLMKMAEGEMGSFPQRGNR